MLRNRGAALALLLCCIGLARGQNLDLLQPIVRSMPSDANAYFGYSAVLHKVGVASSTFEQALENTRIMVGAPSGTATNAMLQNTGVVYSCPVMPGNCVGVTGTGTGDDRRLFDIEGNTNTELKENQFMGGTLASSGDAFIACAHRYVNIDSQNNNNRHPLGRCFISDRDLSGFSEFQPCFGVGQRATYSIGVCQAGTSAALARGDDGNTYANVGAPGVYFWRGIVTRRRVDGGSTRYQDYGSGTSRFGYQGYSMTRGNFLTSRSGGQITREDLAVSVPRRSNYFGSVNIVRNTGGLELVSQPLTGRQMGEYYGFALAAVDLTGDGFDELLVSAPLYRGNSGTAPEAGRVYVYQNTAGSLSEISASPLENNIAYSRFGYAMVSLGDINGDNLDDVAIGAPFGDPSITVGTRHAGTVYIYHGSAATVINPVPQQVITPSDLQFNSLSLANLIGFGTTLASGVDVDDNGYNDLMIGSFQSEQVFLLRSRPVALVTLDVTANPRVVNLNDMNFPCPFSGTDYDCFNVTVCFTYTGRGVNDALNLHFDLALDQARAALGLEQRLFFNDAMAKNSKVTKTMMKAKEVQNCFDETAFIERSIGDLLNGFIVTVDVRTDPLVVTPTENGNGNGIPKDFSQFPTASVLGTSQAQVEIFRDCGGGPVCYPDLYVQVGTPTYIATQPGAAPTKWTVGLVNEVSIPVTLGNRADDAFLAQFRFSLPSSELVFLRSAGLSTQCSEGTPMSGMAEVTCTLPNPYIRNSMTDVTIFLGARNGLSGNEGSIPIEFNAFSLNEENTTDTADNTATATLEINAESDVSIDVPGIFMPEQVVYSAIFTGGSEIVNLTQLGDQLSTSLVVRSRGPSIVPNVEVTIYWPLNGVETGPSAGNTESRYYLYPALISSPSSTTVACDQTYININGSPDNFLLPDIDVQSDQGNSVGQGRRRRSIQMSQKARRRRQTNTGGTPINTTMEGPMDLEDRTLSCIPVRNSDGDVVVQPSEDDLTCVAITCNILQFPPGGSVEIELISFTDERFFAGQGRQFIFTVGAAVRIVDDYIDRVSTANDISTANLTMIPEDPFIVVGGQDNGGRGVAWWVIVVPIVAIVILFAIVFAILWAVGCFRRKKHEEIKEQRAQMAEFEGSSANMLEGANGGGAE